MKIYHRDAQLPFTTAVVLESLDKYCSEVVVTTTEVLKSPLMVVPNQGSEFFVMPYSTRVEDRGNYVYTCMPVRYLEYLNTTFQKVSGRYNLTEICQRMGIEINSRHRTDAVDWTIPECSMQTLLQNLSQGTQVSGGGGACFVFGLDGMLNFVDLKSTWDLFEVDGEFSGQVDSDVSSLDWTSRVPGILDIVQYTPKGYDIRTVTFAEGYSRMKISDYAPDQYSVDWIERMARNNFWENFYTTNIKVVSNVAMTNIGLGYKLVEKMTKKTFIVYGIEASVVENNQQVKLTLVSCPQ